MTPSDTSRRLHPLYLVFALTGSARSLLLPGIVAIFVAAKNDSWDTWVMILFLPAAISAVARYVSFQYRLTDDEIVVTGGVLTRFERHIPFDRIQNINLVQNVVHRMLGIGAVRIETASGDEPEASMEALSLEAIEEIRAFHRRARAPGGTADDAAEPESLLLLRLPLREIVVGGIISNRGIAVVAAALGVLWNLDFALDEWLEAWAQDVEQGRPGAPDVPIGTAIGLVAGGVLGLLVLMRLLSILWFAVELHGFSLRRSDGNLDLEYGLLTRVRATIPVRRIQHVSWRESLLHRLFRRVEGMAVTAGDATREKQSPRRARLAPILRADGVDPLMLAVLPECTLGDREWRTIPRHAWVRLFVPAAVAWTGLAGIAAIWLGPWVFAALGVGLSWSLVHAHRWTATMRWAVTPETVACRSGWPGRRTTVVRRRKVQSVTLTRSPFDRRRNMATVSLDTAGGTPWSASLAIRYLEREEAERLAEELRIDTARRAFEW